MTSPDGDVDDDGALQDGARTGITMSSAPARAGLTFGADPAGTRRASPSMADVAALAGVSPQTVSRVSTGNDKVRPETRQRVLEAMAQIGYLPNSAARALKYGSFRAIGLIAHRLARTGESRTIEAVVEVARAAGYTISLVDVATPSSDDMTAAVTRLTHQSIDGLIIIRAESATPDTLALPPRLPVVVSDSRFVGHLPAVGTDQETGSRLAVEHLLGLGHATVHHLAGPADSLPAAQRIDGWAQALAAADRARPRMYRGDWTTRSGYLQGLRIAEDPEVSAVYCANDEMAIGLYRALYERGRRVPDDISVVGFDNIGVSEFVWPPLTTVAQDFQLIGEQLVALLLRQIDGRERLADHRTVVPVRLVTRSSTCPPRRGHGQAH